MSNPAFHPLILPKKDGLLTLEADSSILVSLKTLGSYLEVYSYLLSPSYNHLVYLDVSAGTGLLEIEKTGENVFDTAMVGLTSPISFNRYIFWEPNEIYAQALRVRINKNFKDEHVVIIGGDMEKFLTQVKQYVPVNSRGIKPWVFCNVNPRFGSPEPEFLEGVKNLDPAVFFIISGLKKKLWKKLNSGKDTFESEARNKVKALEMWCYENNVKLKGSFLQIESSKMNSLHYQGLLCRKSGTSKVVSEIQKKTSNQIRLFQ